MRPAWRDQTLLREQSPSRLRETQSGRGCLQAPSGTEIPSIEEMLKLLVRVLSARIPRLRPRPSPQKPTLHTKELRRPRSPSDDHREPIGVGRQTPCTQPKSRDSARTARE